MSLASRLPVTIPNFIVVDTSWLRDHSQPQELFSVFPIHSIVETFASVPVYSPIDDMLWDELQARCTPEQFDQFYLQNIEFLFEILMTRFYDELRQVIGPELDDKYVWYKWIDRDSMVMIREDLASNVARNLETFTPQAIQQNNQRGRKWIPIRRRIVNL